MSRTNTNLVRNAAFAGLAAFCVSSVTFAQAPAPAADASARVYVNVIRLNGVTATPQSNGTTQYSVQDICAGASCSGGHGL